MTRFAYLTDTHIGCDETGYWLQPRYVDEQAALFEGLGWWLKENAVDFVVHGGDLVDHGSVDEIQRAREWCAMLGVPVYLCLGNHDLAQPDSFACWRKADELLPAGRSCFAVQAEPATLLVVSHHWHSDVDFFWQPGREQGPRLDAAQQAELEAMLTAAPGPVIAVTHAPLNAVPCGQTGLDKPFHPPHAPYLDTWRALADRHPHLRLVLCGHNHAHSQHDHGSFVSCTTAAFSETPAQLRLVEITRDTLTVRTHALAPELGLSHALEPAKSAKPWCVGPTQDHELNITL